jgi:hypothetical protein
MSSVAYIYRVLASRASSVKALAILCLKYISGIVSDIVSSHLFADAIS